MGLEHLSPKTKRPKRPNLPDDDVLLFRWMVRDGEMTRKDVQAATGLGHVLVQRMLCGHTYRHVADPIAVKDLLPPRALTDAQVVEARNAFRCFTFSVQEISEYYGIDHSAVGPMLRGTSYADVPGAVSQEERSTSQRSNAQLTDEQVLYWRRRYRRSCGKIPRREIAKALDISLSAASAMLVGTNYRHVPEAIRVGYAAKQSAVNSLTHEQVREVRRRYDPPRVNVRSLADAFKIDQKQMSEILSGVRFATVPGAVKIQSVHRRMTDADVIECRDLIREQKISIAKLAKKFKLDDSAMANLVRGRTYAYLPGAVPAPPREDPETRKQNKKLTNRPVRFTLDDETVVELRNHYTAANGAISSEDLAAEFGATKYWMRKALSGVTYRHLPNAVVFVKHAPPRVFTDGVARKIRRTYRNDPSVTIEGLATARKVSSKTITNCLLGHTYKNVPGTLTALRSCDSRNSRVNLIRHARRYEAEVVLFMRLNFKAGHVTIPALAKKHKTSEKTIRGLLRGDTYADVPEAVEIARVPKPVMVVPDIPDDIVLRMRQLCASGLRTSYQISTHLKIGRRACIRMLTGLTHAHVPAAIPLATDLPRKAGRKPKTKRAPTPFALAAAALARPTSRKPMKPIKFRPVKLVDHDERVDLVAARSAHV